MKVKSLGDFLYRTFRKDIGRKAMALGLAIMLWFYLDQKVALREIHNLTVRVVSGEEAFYQGSSDLDEGFFIVMPRELMLIEGLQEQTLKVELSGPKEQIQFKLIGRVDVRMQDMEGLDKRKIPLKILNFYFPTLMDHPSIGVDFSPEEIQLNVAKIARAEIGLNQDNLFFTGIEELTRQGKSIESVTFEPNPVAIAGPAPQIEAMKINHSLFKLESVNMSRTANNFNYSRDLGLSSNMLEQRISIRGNTDYIKVKINLGEESGERRLKGMQVVPLFNNAPLTPAQRSRIQLDPEAVNVLFTGPKTQIDVLRDDAFLLSKIWLAVNLDAGPLSLEEVISGELLKPYEIRIFKEDGFNPDIKIETDQRTINVKPADTE